MRAIGIDLGTTNSVVAVCMKTEPEVLENREARLLTPSMVSYRKRKDEGEFLVGSLAYDYWEYDPKNTINSVRRLMGLSFDDADVQKARKAVQYDIVKSSGGAGDSLRVILGGKEYSPVDVSAMILRKMKEDAEFHLGEEVTHAVVTVPAYFSQIQRDATREAALQAGMKVIKILDEPTAAAIAYGLDSGDKEGVKTILVYDLGGSTFDISVLFLSGGVFAQLDLEGDMWLGGDDFDQVLVDYAVKHIKQEYGVDPTSDERAMLKLKKIARKAKESLSSSETTDLIAPGLMRDDSGGYIDLELTITRKQFNDMISPMVKKTVALVEKAMVNAQLVDKETNKPDLAQIDYVLMAGNATMTPLVQQAMEEMFGKERVMRRRNPKLMVALGAARFARMHPYTYCPNPDPDNPTMECGHANPLDATECERCHGPLESVKKPAPARPKGEGKEPEEEPGIAIAEGVAPFSYGVQSVGDKFNVFIKKGEPYPTENPRTHTFYTHTPNQPMISIPVYGGENLEKASANKLQGRAFMALPPGLPKGTPIRVTIWLDDNGILNVAGTLEDGTDLRPWILKGKPDAKAVAIIQEAEKIIAEKSGDISPEDKKKLEYQERRALFQMSQGKFEEAIDEAEKLKEMAGGIGGGELDLGTKAERLISFTEYLLEEYGWAFDSDDASKLEKLVGETKSALESRDRERLEGKFRELDKATDELPEIVRVLLGLKGAVVRRIQPFDIVQARKFSRELGEVEAKLKSARTEEEVEAALKEFANLAQRVTEAIKGHGVVKCSQGHEVPAGERVCPVCGEDAFLPDAGAAAKAREERAAEDVEKEADRSAVPGSRVDLVHFTVTSPPMVKLGTSFVVDIWAHLKQQREKVIKQAQEAAPKSEITIKTKGPVKVARGTVLTVRLQMQGLIVEKPENTIQWEGDIGNADFLVKVPNDAAEGPSPGLATFHVDGLQIARLYFIIKVGKKSSSVEDIPIQPERHRKAFVSYARADWEEVLPRLQGIQKAMPELEIFLDVLSLRSGQNWEEELRKVIPSSDVFYLFWSGNARGSKWVEKEWRCALETRGLDFIDPVPLVSPEEVPPPPELASKHFDDCWLAYMRSRVSKREY